MAIEVKLFGFGSEAPPGFDSRQMRSLDLATPATPQDLLLACGIDEGAGLLMMRDNEVIASDQWRSALIHNGDRLTLMFAIEGG